MSPSFSVEQTSTDGTVTLIEVLNREAHITVGEQILDLSIPQFKTLMRMLHAVHEQWANLVPESEK